MQQEQREYSSSGAQLAALHEEMRKVAYRCERLEVNLSQTQEKLHSALSQQDMDSSTRLAHEALMRSQQETIVRMDNELAAVEREGVEMLAKVDQQEKLVELHRARYAAAMERRVVEIRSLWSIHFAAMDIDRQPLRWAAEQDFQARLEIERALRKLADAEDPVALSRSRMHTTREHHSRFTISKGVECRLFYVVVGGRIGIRRMCKKKDC